MTLLDLFKQDKTAKKILSQESFDVYEKTTSYSSKMANLKDNYSLSRKLKADYESYVDLIKGKKLSHSEIAKLDSFDLSSMNSGNSLSDELSQDAVANAFIDMAEGAQASEIIKLYYGAYISPKSSDIQWRLGNVVDSTEKVDDKLLFDDGGFPTRGTVIPFKTNTMYNGAGITKNTTNYIDYGFPPYKSSIKTNIGADTWKMKKLLAENPDIPFNLDTFSLKKEELTYREMGMKSLSGYINYLQYLLEGVSGVVSTYMTEWDLSIYMQENLVSAADNTIDLTLNYRVRQDNPFSDRPEYRGDKALCFNVCGSTVSKLYHDNEKPWNPADYIYSSWWTPYIKDIDFKLKSYYFEDLDKTIYYLEDYDTFDFNYDYDSEKSFIGLVKHQDILYNLASCKTHLGMRYYDALYSSPDDALSDYDVFFEEYMNEVQGSSTCRTLASLIQDCKIEMLCAGGYGSGLYSAAFNSGGMYGKQSIKSSIEDAGFVSKNEILNQESQLSSAEIEISSDGIVNDTANAKNINGSTLSKMDGISRLAPAIYGGNHGACYSLNSIRGMMTNTILNLNTPTINYTFPKKGENFPDLEIKYKNDENPALSMSPSKAINTLLYGDMNKVYKIASKLVKRGGEYQGDVFINPYNGQYQTSLPMYKDDVMIEYTGPIYWKVIQVDINSVLKPTQEQLNKLNYYSMYNVYSHIYTDKTNPKRKYMIVNVPCRQAVWYEYKSSLVRLPIINDRPELEWNIQVHKFDEYQAEPSIKSTFLQNIRWASHFKFKQDKYTKSAMEQNPGFVLRFPGKPEVEQEIIRQMIWYGLGLNKKNPMYLYFLEGNKTRRFIDGPESIFKAPCYVKYYDKVDNAGPFVKWLRKVFRISAPKSNVPYIYVDLYNVTEFHNNLNIKGCNYKPTSDMKPLHLDATCNFRYTGTEAVSPIQKIHEIGTDILKSQKGATSISKIGLTGIGILTGLIGLEPPTENVLSFNGEDIELDNGLKTSYSEKSPLVSLPLYTAHIDDPTSFYESMTDSMTDILPTQKYVTQPYDVGLKNAYMNMITRITMTDFIDKSCIPYFLDISVPFRNMLSVLVSHKNYLYNIKELIDSVGFEYLRDTLVNNVDRCVLYACGLTFNENGFYKVDTPKKNHILYNYWIDKAVQLLGKTSNLNANKKELENEISNFISQTDNNINTISKILENESKNWSISNIKTLYNALTSIYNTFYSRNKIDDFMMIYLNILYYYRLFYIGNRFNKVDGTMWRMRLLEASLHLTKKPNIILPKSPSDFQVKPERHSVAFYEVQNTTALKTNSILTGDSLDKDRIYRIYVQVQYTNEEAFKKWCAYRDDPNSNERVPEVMRWLVDGQYKYVLKPADGIYQFRSKEYNENEKNIKWNNKHINEIPRTVWRENIDCKFNISWHNSADKTPVRWNVLGNINANSLLEYAPMGIKGEDLVCLIEEGSDFWTINIPANLWPDVTHYKTNLYIKQIFEKENQTEELAKDAYVTVLGPLAHSVSPIIKDPMDVSLAFTK
ncbi:MAG: hypothetical protein HUJ68_04885, partial [Clostridia bacterium]|nr:hypothetical protein [Clostridia bacterium]